MSSGERRQSIALDGAYRYCRELEQGLAKPALFRLCNAIATLDLALEVEADFPLPLTLSSQAWSRVRHRLYDFLLSGCPGYFFVYDDCHLAVEPGQEWPLAGQIEFFPDGTHRSNESYLADLAHLDIEVLNPIRWAFAEGRQQISPSDFTSDRTSTSESSADDAAEAARDLLDKLNGVCEAEAIEGKKKAHRKWWQLYWEANGCPNKRQKHALEKQMVSLQSIWGTPEA